MRLLLLSLILKLFLLGQNEVITNDGPRYINLAIQLTHGDFWAAVKGDITFVYSLVIGALGFFFSDLVLVARLVSLAASVLTVIPLYLLFHDIWNKRIAFLSCLFFVILPCFNEYAVEVMRDPLFLFTFACMMLFAWRALNGRIVYALWFLSLAAISPFLRLESLVFLPFLVLFSLYDSFTKRRRQALYTTVFLGRFPGPRVLRSSVI